MPVGRRLMVLLVSVDNTDVCDALWDYNPMRALFNREVSRDLID